MRLPLPGVLSRVFCVGLLAIGVAAHAQTAADYAKELVGTWKLVGAEQRLKDGTTRPSPNYGPHQAGYMIYTEAGTMCSVTVKEDRPKWSTPNAPTPDDLKSAWDGMGAYCATYTVNAEEKSVTHHVQFDKSPNAAGTDRKRFFTMTGNRLVLKIAPTELGGNVVENTIIWERAAK